MAKYKLRDGVEIQPPNAWRLQCGREDYRFRKDVVTEVPDADAALADLDNHPSVERVDAAAPEEAET
jgi:hypothetical protein